MVAARFALDHGGFARRGETREQHRRFDLRGRNRRPIDDRDRIARAGERDRQAPALGDAHGTRADQRRPDRECAASAACAGSRRRRRSAVMGQPATAPMTRRQPVPELPKSSTAARLAKAADADAVHAPGAFAGALDRGAERRASPLPVLMTSSPSSRPVMRVSPTASAPKISARCEIDLSPGHAHAALERPAAARSQRRRRGWSIVGLQAGGQKPS